MEFKVEIVDKVFKVKSLYEDVYKLCRDYLSENKENYYIELSSEDIEFEREKDKKEREVEGLEVVEFSDGYLECLALYRKIVDLLIGEDVMLFHGSAVEVKGEVYLFTAKSGTGKSTHVRHYEKLYQGQVINDDKPLIKFSDDTIYVYGTPWAGKHHKQINTKGKLKAVCLLNRGKENKIEKITLGEAYPTLLSQAYRFKEQEKMMKTLQLIRKFSNIDLYKLYCTINEESAIISYEGMNK